MLGSFLSTPVAHNGGHHWLCRFSLLCCSAVAFCTCPSRLDGVSICINTVLKPLLTKIPFKLLTEVVEMKHLRLFRSFITPLMAMTLLQRMNSLRLKDNLNMSTLSRHHGPLSSQFRHIASELLSAFSQCFARNVLARKLSIVCQLLLQCTIYTDNVSDYGPLLYSKLGYSTKDQLLLQAGWISYGPIGNLINALLLDKLGRKTIMGMRA